MTTASKDFAPILDDYAFFETHATEAERDAATYARQLAPLLAGDNSIRLLDFGCGTGSFSERLLELLALEPERLLLSLVEPVGDSHRLAAERLGRFTTAPIEQADVLAGINQPHFDVIIANHVLYYVSDLTGTLQALYERLTPGGQFLTALAGNANPLIQFWHDGFALLGQPNPYRVAEDVAAALASLKIPFQTQDVPYELAFEDTEENRLRILRFLFADHFARLPREALVALFAPYVLGARIEFRTAAVHFAITRA
jgi:trans-aconitate 2-methyltransferase